MSLGCICLILEICCGSLVRAPTVATVSVTARASVGLLPLLWDLWHHLLSTLKVDLLDLPLELDL